MTKWTPPFIQRVYFTSHVCPEYNRVGTEGNETEKEDKFLAPRMLQHGQARSRSRATKKAGV